MGAHFFATFNLSDLVTHAALGSASFYHRVTFCRTYVFQRKKFREIAQRLGFKMTPNLFLRTRHKCGEPRVRIEPENVPRRTSPHSLFLYARLRHIFWFDPHSWFSTFLANFGTSL